MNNFTQNFKYKSFITATNVIILINFTLYLFCIFCKFILNSDINFYAILGLNYLFFDGYFWQILSSFFMHGSIAHIVMNMAFLYRFGNMIESGVGAKKFFATYMITGLLTSIFSLFVVLMYHKIGQIVNVVGASGAICAILGMIAFFDKQNAKNLLLVVVIISFAPLLFGENIAWYAHIFGFGLGYLYAKIARKIKFI